MRIRFTKILLVTVQAGVFLTATVSSGAPADDGDEGSPALSTLLGAEAEAGYALADAPREFQFPADHGPHPPFRNEWWYLTGNLDTGNGRRFGYELTLFRFRLTPGEHDEPGSDWAANQVFVGHFAVTDVAAGAFHAAERTSRGAAGLAGARGDPLHVWLYDWSLRRATQGGRGAWQAAAAADGMSLALTLVPEKGPVLHGEGGLSRKSAAAGNASYYYSMPRLETHGRLTLGGEAFDVGGLSWLDREWSSSALGADQAGWDWFSLQLSDGSDLMFYQLRRQDGSRDPHSAGTLMPPDAAPVHLGADDVTLEVLDHWESPAGGRYPMGWRFAVPSRHLDVRIQPVLEDQELHTAVRYWEGAVDVSGTNGTKRITGRGYVELTGYAEALPRSAAP